MKTDVQIAQEAIMEPIGKIAQHLEIPEDELELYGKYKAKISLNYWNTTLQQKENGKLILVTAINPTPAGEGKTTTSIGLGDALHKLGKKTAIALREPSLGPCFGMKGGENPANFQEIADMLTQAGIETTVSNTIELDSWKKLAITGSMSAILCYYDGTIGECRAYADAQEIIPAAYREVQSVAAATGVQMSDNYIETLIKNFNTSEPSTITSLYRDLKSGKAPQDTELDLMVGYVVNKGKELGVPTPVFEAGYNRFNK